jgi:F-type H+-transporting ATPase subunit b
MGYLNQLLLFAAEEGEHGAEEAASGTDLILPAFEELLWGIVAFAVVFFILNKFAFPALRKNVEARDKQIQDDLKQAEDAKFEGQRQLDEYKKQLADARGEANKIIEDARQSAEQVRKDLIAKAEQEAEQVVARAQEQIQNERTRAIGELQSTVSDLSIELAEKIVNRSIDANAHRDLVDAYIKEVAGANGGGSNN